MILEIKKQVYQGWGLAFHQGKAIFVENAIENDVIEGELVREHKNHAFASIKSIQKPSNYRIASACAYSHECGGCQWLEMDYQRQIFWKKKLLAEILRQWVHEEDINFFEATKTLEYRTRVTLRVHIDENGDSKIGYFKNHSWDLVAIDKCFIAHPLINEFMRDFKKLSLKKFQDKKFRFELQILPQLVQTKKALLATIIPAQKHTPHLNEMRDLLASMSMVFAASLSTEGKTAEFFPFEQQGSLGFFTRFAQFQQVNRELNSKMQEVVLSVAKQIEAQNILDLYSGSGNLSLPLTSLKTKIIAVESNKNGVETGKYNAKQNKLSNIEFLAKDSADYLEHLGSKKFDLLIMDPPRAGAKDATDKITKDHFKNIVYVSCDPMTLARDLKLLLKSGDYRVKEINAFDFFPHTYHVETLVWLTAT